MALYYGTHGLSIDRRPPGNAEFVHDDQRGYVTAYQQTSQEFFFFETSSHGGEPQ